MSFNQLDLTNLDNAESHAKAPAKHGAKVGMAKCIYDPSAVTANRAIGPYDLGLTIPKNCLVTGAWYKVLTTFTSATDAGTIALKIVAANDVVSAAAISTGTTWDAAGAIEGTPKLETTASWLTTTSDLAVTATVAVEALTAGKMVIWVQWLYYGDVV